MGCVNVCFPRSSCSSSVTILKFFITDSDVIIILLFYLSFLKRNRSLQRKIHHRKVQSSLNIHFVIKNSPHCEVFPSVWSKFINLLSYRCIHKFRLLQEYLRKYSQNQINDTLQSIHTLINVCNHS